MTQTDPRPAPFNGHPPAHIDAEQFRALQADIVEWLDSLTPEQLLLAATWALGLDTDRIAQNTVSILRGLDQEWSSRLRTYRDATEVLERVARAHRSLRPEPRPTAASVRADQEALRAGRALNILLLGVFSSHCATDANSATEAARVIAIYPRLRRFIAVASAADADTRAILLQLASTGADGDPDRFVQAVAAARG